MESTHELTKNEPSSVKLPFFTLLLAISFASVNAVLFTPGLPDIAHFFSVSSGTAQQTITLFLIGYALSQLIYAPIANRFGRKASLYAGISLQIISSLLCVLSGSIHSFYLLLLGRFLLAIGSGVGLIITFTLVNEICEPKIAAQKISYLMLAFAIAPGLSIALGGILNTYYGWTSCFYLGAVYGLVLLFFTTRITETKTTLDLNALKLKPLIKSYLSQFKNFRLIFAALLMGATTCFIYVFVTLAPFVAINTLGMNSTEYGFANIIPIIGLVAGSVLSAKFGKNHTVTSGIQLGILISACSIALMNIATYIFRNPFLILFFPAMLNYVSTSLIYSNASALAMFNNPDKAVASAVMSFINMGVVTLAVLTLGLFHPNEKLIPVAYIFIIILIIIIYKFYNLKTKK